MKFLLLGSIKLYQLIPGPWHSYCRHIPTCSNYATDAIMKFGSVKGSYLTAKRIFRCTPWGTSGFDPLIKENINENY